MRNFVTSAAAAALAIGFSTAAHAECEIGSTRQASDADRAVTAGETRRDLRQLRSAAQILKAYRKDGACQEVVSVIEDIRQQPDRTRKDILPPVGRMPATRPRDLQTYQERNKERFASAKSIGEVGGRLRVEELMDADLIGSDGKTVGEIEDIIMSESGKPGYVVVGFGGFLGLGEEQAAVPFSQLLVAVNRGGSRTYFLPMTARQLENAPKFKRGDEKWMDDDDWRKRNDEFYRS